VGAQRAATLEAFLLAHVEGPVPSLELDGAAAEGPAGLKCLIAEDNLVNQMVLQRMLKSFQITTDLAKNGAEAVAACEKKRYDIIFMVSGFSDPEDPVIGYCDVRICGWVL